MNSVEQSHCWSDVDGVGTSLLHLGASAAAVRQRLIISVCEIVVGGESAVSMYLHPAA